MKRKVITFVIILICFLLQSTVMRRFAFSAICPNLLIIITASIGFMRGKKEGMAVGLICGFFIDMFWGELLGFHMLTYVLIGYFNGKFQRLFFDNDIKLPIILIGVSELVYGTVFCFCNFILQGKFSIGNYYLHVIFPELVYTVLATLVLYQVILRINKNLEAEEQRSASRFV